MICLFRTKSQDVKQLLYVCCNIICGGVTKMLTSWAHGKDGFFRMRWGLESVT